MTAPKTSTGRRLGRGLFAAWAGALIALAALALAVAPALAASEFGIEPGSFSATVSTDQAGGHPDATVSFRLRTKDDGFSPAEGMKDLVIDLPPGIVGDPQSMPKCTPGEIDTRNGGLCPLATQVGTISLDLVRADSTGPFAFTWPVYNMAPRSGKTAEFGFFVLGTPIFITVSVRPGDRGLRTEIPSIISPLPVRGTRLTLWGDPAAASHNAMRGYRCIDRICFGGNNPAQVSVRPFMRNPTECGRPGAATISVNSWENPDRYVTATADPITMVGCDKLSFDAAVVVAPNQATAGAPAGYTVDLTIPQSDNLRDLGTPDLRMAVVRLPAGVAINSSASDGLHGCTPAQIGLDDNDDPGCPQGSKIGTVQIATPVLKEPLTGGVYLAQPHDNRFGSMLALYLVAQGSGVTLKLPGEIKADPATGQLTATFDDNPQLPFTNLRLSFNGGPRAPLVNPILPGTYTTVAELTSWSGETVTSESTFAISGPATPGFAPRLSAGVQNPAAGAFSPFSLTVARADGDSALKSIKGVRLPEGLLAMISSVPLCDAALAAAGTCPEASRVGHVQVAAGAGATPVWLPQQGKKATGVYLTGSHNGAPYGLSIVVPAQAGPFDLGTVVLRSALHVDQRTAAITADTDDLPTILEGIPLGIREVRMILDRQGFMFNPTSCDATSVDAQVRSVTDAVANLSNRFQVGGCAALPFTPKLTLRVGEKGKTGNGKMPPLEVSLAMTRGQANNRGVRVTLPRTFNSRLRVINDACTLEQFHAGQVGCKQVGTAVAKTPLLDQPLLGKAFFVRNTVRRIPDLMVALQGQGSASLVKVNLTGKVVIPRNLSLQTDFDTVPDVPIDSFTLSLQGGANGVIGNIGNLCTAKTRRALKAGLVFTGQSGKRVARQQAMTVAGCAKATGKAKKAKAAEKKATAKKTTKRK